MHVDLPPAAVLLYWVTQQGKGPSQIQKSTICSDVMMMEKKISIDV